MAETTVAGTFGRRLEALDLTLFDAIPSQTSAGDKRSLLAIQHALTMVTGPYVYLEIGSYLGGSLQPHLTDPHCELIYSIDKRPLSQPDARGTTHHYQQNSTARMIENLRRIDSSAVGKITTIDGDAKTLPRERIARAPQYCFIDGEHTDTAVFDDFTFCLAVCDRNGLIAFHDAAIVYKGLYRIIKYLEAQQVTFRAYALPDTVFVIELNDMKLHDTPPLRAMLVNNHVAYLASLLFNDGYRTFANKPLFRLLRTAKAMFTRKNVYE